MDFTTLLPSLLGGYLLGSIPFGLVLARLAGYGDIRKIGSGNIGATNVLRTGNKPLAAMVLLLDSGKGAIATLLAGLIVGNGLADPASMPASASSGLFVNTTAGTAAGLAAGVAAVFGHNFPIWLQFKGGKGVATTLGALIAISWPVGLSACALWVVSAALFRISSLAALVSLAIAPVIAWVLGDMPTTVSAGLLALLVWARHSANIRRLFKGEEPKIGKK